MRFSKLHLQSQKSPFNPHAIMMSNRKQGKSTQKMLMKLVTSDPPPPPLVALKDA